MGHVPENGDLYTLEMAMLIGNMIENNLILCILLSDKLIYVILYKIERESLPKCMYVFFAVIGGPRLVFHQAVWDQ